MQNILKNRHILVLVTGSIAIYKALDLISRLKKMGAEVAVAMSDEAQKFITPMTFEALSGRAVLTSGTQSFASEDSPSHINYARWAHIALLAPASVNSIAKLRCGIADSVVIATLLACKCPIFIAPSANVNMIESPQNRANLAALEALGVGVIAPRVSRLACNITANGAMASVDELLFALQKCTLRREFWAGRRVVVTGGGSVEKIDAVRCIGNLSSGLQAANLALAFYFLGAEVALISSRFPLKLPLGIRRVEVDSAQSYKAALNAEITEDSLLLMAAAISDYRAKNPAAKKLKKAELGEEWQLDLAQNEDILGGVECAFKLGFKAESDESSGRFAAQKMLQSPESGGKGCDMVALNIVGESGAIGGETNEITLFTRETSIALGQKDKFNLSLEIAAAVEKYLDSPQGTAFGAPPGR